MKKTLSLIFLFFVMIFSSFYSVKADVVPGVKDKLPYSCDDCSLKEGIDKARGEIKDIYNDENKGASDYIQEIVVYLLGFLYFVSVVIIIYAGFNILTAAGDEEKVSKSKKIILFAIIGMVIIFLAGPISNFVLQIFEQAK